jgi:hypothetical protein
LEKRMKKVRERREQREEKLTFAAISGNFAFHSALILGLESASIAQEQTDPTTANLPYSLGIHSPI